MKKTPKLSAISAVAISAIILSSAYIYVEVQKSKIQPARISPERKVSSQPVSPEMERSLAVIFGKSLEEDKQAFEDIIHQLAFVSVDDMNRGLGTAFKIDMSSRKQYFKDVSWGQYQKYVIQQKEDIKTLGTDSGAPYKCEVHFNYGSQKYSQDKAGNTIFLASGLFSCGAWDAYDSYGEFKITVLAAGDVTKPKDLKIMNWNMEILEPVRPKKYPCVDPKNAKEDPHFEQRLVYQKKNGCI
ncbi:MAG TPA: hypothetical protein VFS88_03215 [Micavibrio sp.]|nr:hypothetical protein [Micavibrio sp.]